MKKVASKQVSQAEEGLKLVDEARLCTNWKRIGEGTRRDGHGDSSRSGAVLLVGRMANGEWRMADGRGREGALYSGRNVQYQCSTVQCSAVQCSAVQ